MVLKHIIAGGFMGLALGPAAISIEDAPLVIHTPVENLQIVQATALAPVLNPETILYTPLPGAPRYAHIRQRRTVITAYSSTPDQTDATPFITAIGTEVRDGIVAANWLPIGTHIRLPELYGEKIFVVEDRMHPKNPQKVDIWMPTRDQAREFGVRRATVEVF